MRFASVACLALLAAAPAAARPLTVAMGETWIFTVANGEPARARKAAAAAVPAAGELKVTLQPLLGATMTIVNNSRFDYAYRATLVVDGRAGPAKSCAVPAYGRPAMEHWPRPVAAVRLSRFRRAPAGSLCP